VEVILKKFKTIVAADGGSHLYLWTINKYVEQAAVSASAAAAAAAAASAKPEAFIDMVESVSPGPYLELFARRNWLGWSTWGNEALNHINL
jgi:N6-adenosine-specific RNA methylase IME4